MGGESPSFIVGVLRMDPKSGVGMAAVKNARFLELDYLRAKIPGILAQK